MRDANELGRLLGYLSGEDVALSLDGTDACIVRGTRTGAHSWRLSVHPCFLLASEETVRALASHLRHPGRATAQALRAFVRAARGEIPAGPRRHPRLTPVGRHFDLREIRDAVNAAHFGGSLRTKITWGKTGTPRRRRRRSIVFGSYDAATDTVRIHPELDSAKTPKHFLEYIVFHELLHAVHPVRIGPGGRRIVHTAEFRRAERRYPGLKRALDHLARWKEGELG